MGLNRVRVDSVAKLQKKKTMAELQEENKHWDDLKKNGCSDPAWPDGVNLNLVRNHIIYW